MASHSSDRLSASFTETGGHVRLSVNIEADQVIFPGREASIAVRLSDEETRDLRQALVNLKGLAPKTEWPHPTSGMDTMLTLKVTQPPTLAMDIRGSYHNLETPREFHSIRTIIGQASRRINTP